MLKNINLKVIDLSFNHIAGEDPLISANISKFLSKPHPELIHFDISYCGFNAEDIKSFAYSLNKNNLLIGFHF